jgi:SAM-dependent methyltransferase
MFSQVGNIACLHDVAQRLIIVHLIRVFKMNKPVFAFDGESLITPELISADIHRREGATEKVRSAAKLSLVTALDKALADFESGTDPRRVVFEVTIALHVLRNTFPSEIWQELLVIGREHAVTPYFLQDPFTNWSFVKPRGYSGDAALLDFFYFHPEIAEHVLNATPLGKAIYTFTSRAPSSIAGRERLGILTKYVDDAAMAKPKEAEVLSIACGNLREGATSIGLFGDKLKRWVALDQDPQSVATVAKDYAGTVVEPTEGSVRTVLLRGDKLGTFDLVYTSGLYDYLADKVAVKLTKKCLSMLKPGGKLMFCNYAKDIFVDGYMELFMNWALLLRNDNDMATIIKDSIAGDEHLYETKVFYGENRNIVYGEIALKS